MKIFLRALLPVFVVSFLCTLLPVLVCHRAHGAADETKGLITDVKLSSVSFSPVRGQSVSVTYQLGGPCRLTATVYDPDLNLVKVLCDGAARKAGPNTEIWDGKDVDGRVVPDEAYFFTIEAAADNGRRAVYDPFTFSGGDQFDITRAAINRESNTVVYQLQYPARVMIRMGVGGGPLLKTLVDWKPRIAGEITEYWNGMDEDNLLNLRDHAQFKMVITGYRLPESCVITYGNTALDYVSYKASLPTGRPLKESRPVQDRPNALISTHYALSRIVDRSPRIVMSFPEIDSSGASNPLVISGKTLVHVDLDQACEKFFSDQQFEISFFLDGSYYAEEEVGYSPYNWVWDPSNVSEGEHILTVNMSSFKDQIGIASRKVKVVRQ